MIAGIVKIGSEEDYSKLGDVVSEDFGALAEKTSERRTEGRLKW